MTFFLNQEMVAFFGIDIYTKCAFAASDTFGSTEGILVCMVGRYNS